MPDPRPTPTAVSEALDSISQTVGAILIRTANGWQVIPPGPAGYILVSTGPDTPPEWQPPP